MILQDTGFWEDWMVLYDAVGRFPFYIMIVLGLYVLYRIAHKEGIAQRV